MKQQIKKIIPDFILNKYHAYIKNKELELYKGNNVKCPICNSEYSSYARIGDRENARCIQCESMERHRLLWLYLIEKTDLFQTNLRLLHFAPEKIFYDNFSLRNNIDYFPCDLFPEHYDYKGKVKISKVDITNIPYENDFFDVVICNHVLEHIPDDIKAMQELYRVMKKGSWGIFQVPIDYSLKITYEDFSITTPKEREKAFGLKDHVRIYGCDYKEKLASVGFEIMEDDYVNSLTPDERSKYGLDTSELIYLGRK